MMENLFKAEASVQYNDYTGHIAFDGHNGPMLHKLCEDNNVDSKYFPIAFKLYDQKTMTSPFLNETEITIYCVNKEEAGSSFDEITQFIKKNNGRAKITKIDMSISYSDLSKYIKRMGVFVIQSGMEEIVKEFVDEDDSEL